MKKYWNLICFYSILAMIGGVFYREFTKFNDFTGITSLGRVHVHAFMLGMMFFLVALLLEKSFALSKHKRFQQFLILYNVGLIGMISMLIVRGVPQVLQLSLSAGFNASISGIAGIFHILLGVGILIFVWMLKDQIKIAESK